MAKTWTLIDVAKDVHHNSMQLGAGDLPAGCSIRLRTLGGGLREGVQVLEVDNGAFQFTVLPQRGMGLWRARLGEMTLGWQSPVRGPVHPKFVPVAQPDGLGWLQGFDEMLARCGLESNGAPDFDEKNRLQYPLHGRIANLPAHRLEVGVDPATGELVVSGEVEEAKLHHAKLRLKASYRTKPGQAGLRIVDEVVNFSGAPGECQLLYHVNFGPPLCQPGSRVFIPVKEIVPRTKHAAEDIGHWDVFGPARPGFEEQVYFYAPAAAADGKSLALLHDPGAQKGVSLHWSTKQLPCFTLWKNTPAFEDGYVTGIEPGANFPNPRTFEKSQNRVIALNPGESRTIELGLVVHADAASVAQAAKAIGDIQAVTAPTIHGAPQPGWCAS